MGATIRPAGILSELEELWTGLGKQVQEDGSVGVLRACSMTLLVVMREPSDRPVYEETLGAVARQHPARIIEMVVSDREERSLEAAVSAQCWMPFGKRQHICSERVTIRATRAALADLPPVLRALLVPDLPVTIWLRDLDLASVCDIVPLCSLTGKVILNSSGCTEPGRFFERVAEIRSAGTVAADLSWTRLTRWRESFAQLFANPERRKCAADIEQVTVTHYGASVPIRALYLGAWLRNASGGRAAVVFQPSELHAPCQENGEVQAASLDGPGLSVRISQLENEAVTVALGQTLHRTVFHRLSEAELLSDELAIDGRDTVFEGALATARQLHQGMR